MDTSVDFRADHLRKLLIWMDAANNIASREGGQTLMMTLGDLARTKPEAFDRLAPTITDEVWQALRGALRDETPEEDVDEDPQ